MKSDHRSVVSLGVATRPEPRQRHENDFVMPDGRVSGLVVLATTDPVSIEWAPRWLRRHDLAVQVVSDVADLMRFVGTERPELLIVDAPLVANSGGDAASALASAVGELPAIVLCANNREVRLASEIGAAEVSRRPYDWQLIAERSVRVLEAHRRRAELKRVRRELREAVSEAVATERDRLAVRDVDALTDLPTRDRFRDLLEKSMSASRAAAFAGSIMRSAIGLATCCCASSQIG